MPGTRPGPVDRSLGIGTFRRFRRNPLDFLSDLAKQFGDIAFFRLGPYRACLLNAPDLIRDVLVTQRESFRKAERQTRAVRQLSGESFFLEEGKNWLRQRRRIQPAFLSDRMERYGSEINSCIAQALAHWPTEGVVNFCDEMFDLVVSIVAKSFFSVEPSDQPADLLQAARRRSAMMMRKMNAVAQLPDWLPLPSTRRDLRAKLALDRFIREVIQKRRKESDDPGDVLSLLMHGGESEGNGESLNDEQIRNEAMLLLNAGYDNAAAALPWTFYLLAQHPEVQARVADESDRVFAQPLTEVRRAAELKYTTMVIQESLRMYPPNWCMIAREAVESVMIGEHEVPQGTWVFIAPYVLHHDPRYFDRPDAFQPERFSDNTRSRFSPYVYMPFGAGPRVCIGYPFAMLELVLVVSAVCHRYWLNLEAGAERIRPLPLATLRPKPDVRLRCRERQAVTKVFSQED